MTIFFHTLGGQNPHLWQSWAILESKQGNISQARKVVFTSTVSILWLAARSSAAAVTIVLLYLLKAKSSA